MEPRKSEGPSMSVSEMLRRAKDAEMLKKAPVSKLWKEITGLPWSEAKKLGYSDGTAKTNLELRKKLASGELTKKNIKTQKVDSRPVPKAVPKAETPEAEIKMPKQTVSDKMEKEVAESKASPMASALRKQIKAEKKANRKGSKIERLQRRLNRLQSK